MSDEFRREGNECGVVRQGRPNSSTWTQANPLAKANAATGPVRGRREVASGAGIQSASKAGGYAGEARGRRQAADTRQRRRLSSGLESNRREAVRVLSCLVESSRVESSRVVSRRKSGPCGGPRAATTPSLGARKVGSPRLGQQTVPTPRTLLFVSARGAVRCGERRRAVGR